MFFTIFNLQNIQMKFNKLNNLSKSIFFFIISALILATLYYLIKHLQTNANKYKYNPNKNKKYIFSYGSLTNLYIQKVLLKHIKTLPPKAILSKESGYKRMWVEEKNNGVSLGIFKTDNPGDINGIILEFDESQMADIDKYEKARTHHIKEKISWTHVKVANKSAYEKNDLYIYVINEQPHKANIVEKMPNLYAQNVMEGFNRYGEDYLDLFLSTTE